MPKPKESSKSKRRQESPPKLRRKNWRKLNALSKNKRNKRKKLKLKLKSALKPGAKGSGK